MKIYTIFLSVLLTLLLSACILDDEKKANSASEINSAKEEYNAVVIEYQEKLEDDPECATVACQQAKETMQQKSAEYQEVVQNGVFAYSLTFSETHGVKSYTDSTIIIEEKTYRCSSAVAVLDSYNETVEYSIDDGILHLKYWACEDKLYSGNSGTIIGAWNYINTEFDYTKRECSDENYNVNSLKETASLVIDENTYKKISTVQYNCLVDDAFHYEKKDTTFKKIDCNSYSSERGGMKKITILDYQAASPSATSIVEYKGKKCSKVYTYNYSNLDKPDCETQLKIFDAFDECMGELLKVYCPENPSDKGHYCEVHCEDYPDAEFCTTMSYKKQ